MTGNEARELLERHHARYEVSSYYVLLDVRTQGTPPVQQRIHAGFDVDLYATGSGHEPLLSKDVFRTTIHDLCAAFREVLAPANGAHNIEIIPFETSVVLNVEHQLDPEALVRIRITHTRGLDQPAGEIEEKTLNDVIALLHTLGVRRT
jgi:hypothetical protein